MMGSMFSPIFACLIVIWSLTITNITASDPLRIIRFVSPIQSLTIWDPEVKEELRSQRLKFLDKYASGLKAEAEARKELADGKEPWLETKTTTSTSGSSDNWAREAASKERNKLRAEEEYLESCFDEAVQKFSAQNAAPKKERRTNSNQYQFVGVVNEAKSESPISWYARKKPPNSKWSVRLVHANRNAIIKDMFARGKVDIFAKYENTGKFDPETNNPVVTSKYSVAERSWKNLWNFSPKHFFTDPSGMYWRERRLPQGLYTDGKTVYEATYRYRDGRNGMHRVSTLQQYLQSKGVDSAQKERILKKLMTDEPDLVLEG